MGGKSS